MSSIMSSQHPPELDTISVPIYQLRKPRHRKGKHAPFLQLQKGSTANGKVGICAPLVWLWRLWVKTPHTTPFQNFFTRVKWAGFLKEPDLLHVPQARSHSHSAESEKVLCGVDGRENTTWDIKCERPSPHPAGAETWAGLLSLGRSTHGFNFVYLFLSYFNFLPKRTLNLLKVSYL